MKSCLGVSDYCAITIHIKKLNEKGLTRPHPNIYRIGF